MLVIYSNCNVVVLRFEYIPNIRKIGYERRFCQHDGFSITVVGNIFKPKYNIGTDVVFRFGYIPNIRNAIYRLICPLGVTLSAELFVPRMGCPFLF